MRGAIPPLPNTPSWRDAQLKESTEATSVYLCKRINNNEYSSHFNKHRGKKAIIDWIPYVQGTV